MTDESKTELPEPTHGPDGRFLPGRSGNPYGRPPGPSKQQKLLNRMMDEAGEVLDAMLAKAKEGDPSAAGLVLSRIIPSLRSQMKAVEFNFDPDLPIGKQIEQVLAAVAAGEVPPDVGQTIISAIGTLGNIRAVEDLETRLVPLESKAVN